VRYTGGLRVRERREGMSKTRFGVVTALVLIGLSAMVFVMRRAALGEALYGPPAANAWRVTLAVTGQLTAKDASVIVLRPPDFRHQHVFDESFQSTELLAPKGKAPSRPELVWRRSGMGGGGSPAFWLSYSFHCLAGMRQPTPDMRHLTRDLD